jgi:predicted transcriptional regulator
MKRTLTIHTDGLEGFRKRSLDRARKLDRGELLEPEKIVTFDKAFKTLTPARIGVFRKVKEEKKEISITALAHSLKRSREAVSRDVTVLKSAGIVTVRNITNPGHGKAAMVSPAAKKIFVEI